MTPDYLDLLLDRAMGAVPLVEPRLAPATLGPVAAPEWQEIASEMDQPPGRAFPGSKPVSQRSQESAVPTRTSPPIIAIAPRSELRQADHRSQQSAVDGHDAGPGPGPSPAVQLVETQTTADPDRSHDRRSLLGDPPQVSSAVQPFKVNVAAQASVATSTKIVERTIQTNRWLPGQPSAESGIRDRLIPAPSTPVAAPEPAPISIRIDRIEVRAAGSAPSAIAPLKPRAAAPLGLDEYLKRKSRGDR